MLVLKCGDAPGAWIELTVLAPLFKPQSLREKYVVDVVKACVLQC